MRPLMITDSAEFAARKRISCRISIYRRVKTSRGRRSKRAKFADSLNGRTERHLRIHRRKWLPNRIHFGCGCFIGGAPVQAAVGADFGGGGTFFGAASLKAPGIGSFS